MQNYFCFSQTENNSEKQPDRCGFKWNTLSEVFYELAKEKVIFLVIKQSLKVEGLLSYKMLLKCTKILILKK